MRSAGAKNFLRSVASARLFAIMSRSCRPNACPRSPISLNAILSGLLNPPLVCETFGMYARTSVSKMVILWLYVPSGHPSIAIAIFVPSGLLTLSFMSGSVFGTPKNSVTADSA